MVESSHSGSGVLSRGGMRKSKGGKSSRRALEGDVTQLLLGPRSNHRWAYREPDLPARIGATFKASMRKQILSGTVQVYSPRAL